jgi:hypothetical protein
MSDSIVPGTREPGTLTTFGTPAASMTTCPDGPSTMDAVTIVEHQREGGGAPSQRRPARARRPWTGVNSRLHGLAVATRLLFQWRLRTNHV